MTAFEGMTVFVPYIDVFKIVIILESHANNLALTNLHIKYKE